MSRSAANGAARRRRDLLGFAAAAAAAPCAHELAFNHNGKMLAAAGADGEIRLFEEPRARRQVARAPQWARRDERRVFGIRDGGRARVFGVGTDGAVAEWSLRQPAREPRRGGGRARDVCGVDTRTRLALDPAGRGVALTSGRRQRRRRCSLERRGTRGGERRGAAPSKARRPARSRRPGGLFAGERRGGAVRGLAPDQAPCSPGASTARPCSPRWRCPRATDRYFHAGTTCSRHSRIRRFSLDRTPLQHSFDERHAAMSVGTPAKTRRRQFLRAFERPSRFGPALGRLPRASNPEVRNFEKSQNPQFPSPVKFLVRRLFHVAGGGVSRSG